GVYTQNVRSDTTGFTATELPQQNLINVGLDLNIRPTIYNNGLVEMEVEISNDSAVVTQRIFNDRKFDAVGTKNQEIQSTLMIPSGETRVIGGLVRQDRNESRSGIPGLVKLPLVGPLLFGKYDRPAEQNGRQMLLIFLTPTIIADKPTETLKYKGRIVTSDEQVAVSEEPNVTPTESDTWLAPLEPHGVPPKTKLGKFAEKDERQLQTTPASETEQVALEPPPAESAQREEAQPTHLSQANMQDVKRIAISESSTTGAQALMARITGPSGALTGPAGGQVPAAAAAAKPGTDSRSISPAPTPAVSGQQTRPGMRTSQVGWTPRPPGGTTGGLATPPPWRQRETQIPPRGETRY
ncbi:MAG: type II secretion system protein GspD, partial [Candidatus Sumerlaeaceae bacterium]